MPLELHQSINCAKTLSFLFWVASTCLPGSATWKDDCTFYLTTYFFRYQMGSNSSAILACLMSHATNAPVIGHTSYEMQMLLFSHWLLCSIHDLGNNCCKLISYARFWPWKKIHAKSYVAFIHSAFNISPRPPVIWGNLLVMMLHKSHRKIMGLYDKKC
jgi:hypothetical protein